MNDFLVDYLEKIKIPYIILSYELIEMIKAKKSVTDVIKADLSSSFDQGFVVYYRELITEEILLLLHDFFRNTCCNIENIVLITVQGVGVKRFYQQYCDLHKTRGFNIIETPWMYWIHKYILSETEQYKQLPKRQEIKSLFTYYGGTYELDPPERTIMSVFASQYSTIAHVDTMFAPAEWQQVENYLEYLTYFSDVESINNYRTLYDSAVVNKEFSIKKLINTGSVPDERFIRQGPQWTADSNSFFSLIRETVCTQNFYCLTEKTMRCFFHGVALIPTHGEHIISDLEELGFIINRSFIDYSYLNEENLIFRLQKLKEQLDKLKQTSFDDWYSIWIDNYKMFNYNSEYLVNSYKTNIIIPRLDNYFI